MEVFWVLIYMLNSAGKPLVVDTVVLWKPFPCAFCSINIEKEKAGPLSWYIEHLDFELTEFVYAPQVHDLRTGPYLVTGVEIVDDCRLTKSDPTALCTL